MCSTTISTKSSTIFITPAATVTISPIRGRSAVTISDWNIYCRMKKGNASRRMRPYSTHKSSIAWSAPRNSDTCGRNAIPAAPNTIPTAAPAATNSENTRCARSFCPSPSILATSALPPVPSIYPTTPSTIRNGKIRFTAAKAVLPTKFDTNIPSTML